MATKPPQVEIKNAIGTPQAFGYIKHADRHDGTRGVVLGLGPEHDTSMSFLTYTEAVRLYEALNQALAFLDDDADQR